MKSPEPAVPARYFAQLIDYLEAQGTPCRELLGAGQLRSLNDARALITPDQLEALLPAMARMTGRGDLGFELGKLIKLNSHDVLGYAIISCPTIDHMLRLVARYYRLMTPMFAFRYERLASHAEVSFVPIMAMSEAVLRFHIEMLTSSFHCQMMAITGGKQKPIDFYLALPAPAHLHRYRELAPSRIHFSAEQLPSVRIVLGTELFDQPLPMTDLRVLQQAEARCKLLLQEVSESGKWSDWVAMMLREAEDCQPSLDELARILNISARTLDRYLDKEGVSFRALSLRIRNERACQLLASGKFAVSQIAYRLGFTDIANFSRFFKRMNGITPSAYMEKEVSDAA